MIAIVTAIFAVALVAVGLLNILRAYREYPSATRRERVRDDDA
jgi:hypothetical protein